MMCSNLAPKKLPVHYGILYHSRGATLIQVIVDVGWKDRAALSLATVLTEHQWRTEQHSLAVLEEKHANPVRDIYSLCNIQLADLQQVS